MNKKILISVMSFLLVIFLFAIVWRIVLIRKTENLVENNNIVELSDYEITDICTDEWAEFNSELQKSFEEASANVSEDYRYIIKSVEGYIYVYYLDKNNDEILYKKTSISTEYLSQEDIDNLEIGIEVEDSEEMNKMLENFE